MPCFAPAQGDHTLLINYRRSHGLSSEHLLFVSHGNLTPAPLSQKCVHFSQSTEYLFLLNSPDR